MKRFLIMVSAVIMAANINVFANNGTETMGKEVLFTEVAPYTNSDAIELVPISVIADAADVAVTWDGVSRTVKFTNHEYQSIIKIGSDVITTNAQNELMECPAVIMNDRTYVPLSAVEIILNTKIENVDGTLILLNDEVEEVSHNKHWSYDGETSPEHWGELSDDYYLAIEGKNQSPVNIDTDEVKEVSNVNNVEVNYNIDGYTVVNNGHAIEVVPENSDNYIIYNDEKYNLAQFHIHSLSEHTVNEEHLPLEIHFVNKNEAGEITVIGVFAEVGDENSALANIFANLDPNVGSETKFDANLDLSDVLSFESGFYTYPGSLTTPPLTEGVNWVVLVDKISLSAEQLENFTNIYDHNYRPVQELNDREIEFNN